jgi:hypothetical protein
MIRSYNHLQAEIYTSTLEISSTDNGYLEYFTMALQQSCNHISSLLIYVTDIFLKSAERNKNRSIPYQSRQNNITKSCTNICYLEVHDRHVHWSIFW